MTLRRLALFVAAGLIAAALWLAAPSTDAEGPLRFSGASDASAAVALDDATFIVADDENNTLRLYRCDRPGSPVESIPWDAHLGIDGEADEHPEADIEGAAALGGRIYWISSHGRNKDGKWRPNRHRFFAITVKRGREGIRLEPFGEPVADLALRLVADPRLRRFHLDAALRPDQDRAKKLAPKREGLNIEGLSAMPDGHSLLLALRNPRPNGKALLISLANPEAVLCEAASPQFGDPIELDLGFRWEGEKHALGVRSIEYSPADKSYLIVAGPQDEEHLSAVYRWSGGPADVPELLPGDTAAVNRQPAFSPEALILFPGHGRILVLSDDGALRVKVASPAECRKGTFENGECEAKDLLDESRKTFRGLWLSGK